MSDRRHRVALWRHEPAGRTGLRRLAARTRSPTIRTDPDKVREYFGILKKVPDSYKVTLNDQHVRVYGDVAINTGSYTFSQLQNDKEVLRPSRFSFVYRKSGDHWLIVDHHSSAVPEAAK